MSLSYQPIDPLNLEATCYLYFNRNISNYEKAVFSAKAEYQLNQWLKPGIDYRFGLKKGENYHDIRYAVNLENPIGQTKWAIGLRPTLQQKIIDKDSQKIYLRNRLKLDYKADRNIKFYVFTEPYLDLQQNFGFDTQKSALGVEIKMGKHGMIQPQFTLKNKKNQANYVRLELSYRYSI